MNITHDPKNFMNFLKLLRSIVPLLVCIEYLMKMFNNEIMSKVAVISK